MKPLSTFRVSCENKSLYFKVLIWRTLGDLRAANPGNRKTLGLCRPYRIRSIAPRGSGRRDRLKPILGEIHLAKTHLKVGIISHECCHAMMTWAEETKCIPLFRDARQREATRKSFNNTLTKDDPEERCCFVLGNLVRQIVIQLYERKLID